MTRSRLSLPALLLSVLVVAALAFGGGAVAGGKIGSKNIKAGAVKTSKIKDGAVTTAKLADGAVTASELDPSQRADAFHATHGQLALPAGQDTAAIQVVLPTPGEYAVTVEAQLGNISGAANSVRCDLLDADNPLASSQTTLDSSATFQSTISLTGFSDGGVVKLSCNPNAGASARQVALTAVRVAGVTELTSTP